MREHGVEIYFICLEARPVVRIWQQGEPRTRRRAKTRRGGHIFKIQYWMFVATGGPNVKRGGPGTTGPPDGDGPA